MYNKILVPLDGSKLAECALSHVKNLVKGGVAGEITLLNVVNLYLLPAGRGEYRGLVNINEIRENLLAESRAYLAGVESRLASEGIQVKKESIEGNRPAATISDYAQRNGMELIVIATHGYTGLKKALLGSVASSVLQESHIPILLIRP